MELIMISPTIFSIDAETVGLYGEPFAVAYTVSLYWTKNNLIKKTR